MKTNSRRFSFSESLFSFIKPIVIIIAVLAAILPFWWLTAASFKSGNLYEEGWRVLFPEHLTLDYYKKLLLAQERLPLLRFLGNTAFYCAAGVFLELALAALAAYPLARLNFKGKGAVTFILIAVLALPAQANAIINFTTVRALGLYDTMLGVILPGAVSVFAILLLRQAFAEISSELEDAARLDGCGEWQIFTNVCLPLTRPTQAAVALFAFVANWNSFLWPLVVLKSADKYPLSVGLAYLASSFDSDFRVTAAGSVLAALPMIIFFLAIQKEFVKGITAGALKG
ncbi:carbohydrate ABC transporter permease [bacterium]|nr:carbohydrate ABC transporter permease [bacterium]